MNYSRVFLLPFLASIIASCGGGDGATTSSSGSGSTGGTGATSSSNIFSPSIASSHYFDSSYNGGFKIIAKDEPATTFNQSISSAAGNKSLWMNFADDNKTPEKVYVSKTDGKSFQEKLNYLQMDKPENLFDVSGPSGSTFKIGRITVSGEIRVADNAKLSLYQGNLNGGKLTKADSGTIVFEPLTDLFNGTEEKSFSLSKDAQIIMNVTLPTGTALGVSDGGGTVQGNLTASGGTIILNSGSTLNVSGDLTASSPSVLRLKLNATTSTLLKAKIINLSNFTIQATINGGKVNSIYTLDATNSLTGAPTITTLATGGTISGKTNGKKYEIKIESVSATTSGVLSSRAFGTMSSMKAQKMVSSFVSPLSSFYGALDLQDASLQKTSFGSGFKMLSINSSVASNRSFGVVHETKGQKNLLWATQSSAENALTVGVQHMEKVGELEAHFSGFVQSLKNSMNVDDVKATADTHKTFLLSEWALPLNFRNVSIAPQIQGGLGGRAGDKTFIQSADDKVTLTDSSFQGFAGVGLKISSFIQFNQDQSLSLYGNLRLDTTKSSMLSFKDNDGMQWNYADKSSHVFSLQTGFKAALNDKVSFYGQGSWFSESTSKSYLEVGCRFGF